MTIRVVLITDFSRLAVSLSMRTLCGEGQENSIPLITNEYPGGKAFGSFFQIIKQNLGMSSCQQTRDTENPFRSQNSQRGHLVINVSSFLLKACFTPNWWGKGGRKYSDNTRRYFLLLKKAGKYWHDTSFSFVSDSSSSFKVQLSITSFQKSSLATSGLVQGPFSERPSHILKSTITVFTFCIVTFCTVCILHSIYLFVSS